LAGFNFLDVAPAQLGLLGQYFLGKLGGSAKTTNILPEGNMRCPLHLSDDAALSKVESEL
jgi:hypothetical protein